MKVYKIAAKAALLTISMLVFCSGAGGEDLDQIRGKNPAVISENNDKTQEIRDGDSGNKESEPDSENSENTGEETSSDEPDESDPVSVQPESVTADVKSESNIRIVKTMTDSAGKWAKEFEYMTFYDSLSGKCMPYRLHVPENYTPNDKYPVILFLHGAGEIGSDNEKHLQNFVQGFILSGDILENAIIVCPQTPSGWGIDEYEAYDRKGYLGVAKRILDNAIEQYNGDRDRIYLTGLSLGSFAVWRMLEEYPGFFAAAVPVCGGNGYYASQVIIDTPLWIFHGIADSTVPYSSSADTYNAIRDAGGSLVRFTGLSGVGHNAWDYAYTDREMFCWLFSQNIRTHQSTEYDYINACEIVTQDNTPLITEKDFEYVFYVVENESAHLEVYLTDTAYDFLREEYEQNKNRVLGFNFGQQRIYDFKFTSSPQNNILRIEKTVDDGSFRKILGFIQGYVQKKS